MKLLSLCFDVNLVGAMTSRPEAHPAGLTLCSQTVASIDRPQLGPLRPPGSFQGGGQHLREGFEKHCIL